MGKKRGWFGFLKRLFVCKTDSTKEKGSTRKWCFGILKFNRYYHALETPKTEMNDHEEDGKQHTMALAIAMTAAAEAAVAAANAAAEVARLVKLPGELEMRTQITAAIKIQSSYRAHLAWKALIGLRGVVKLQALIRGQIVRRKLSIKLTNTYRSKVHRIRIPTFDQVSKFYKEKQDHLSPRNDRRNEQLVEDTHQEKSTGSNKTKKLRFRHKDHSTEEHNSQSFGPQMLYSSRRHYHLSPDRSDDTSLPNSPVFPAYMATTESFMAKARSLSTPRQRLSFLDGYCTHGSPFGMPMLDSSSSFNGRMKGEFYRRNMHL